jgi:hypothetical protein
MLQSKSSATKPSLLRQIVDEVDSLDEQSKKEVLRKIKMQKALQLAKKADEQLAGAFKEMTDEALDDMVSNNRSNKNAKQ